MKQDVDPVLQGLSRLVSETVPEPEAAPLPYRANKATAFRKPAKKTAYAHTPNAGLLADEHAMWMKDSEKRKQLRQTQNQKRRQYVQDTKTEITNDNFMTGVNSDVSDRLVAKDLRYAMKMGQIPEWRQEVSNYRVSTPAGLKMHDPPEAKPKIETPEVEQQVRASTTIVICLLWCLTS
jgi:hypothetical protein